MPQKITLTGMPKSEARDCNTYFAFEMIEKGSPTGPKGIPFKSTPITYTVFVSKKQFNKIEMNPEGFKHTKLLVQGEPTLDVSVEKCPGEIGVICMQIQGLPSKPTEEDKTAEKSPIEHPPEGTQDILLCKEIVLGEKFKTSKPRQEKQDSVIESIKKTGTIDTPILIDKETKLLKDGFSRYFVAQKMSLEYVPVCYT
ncbi:plasmid stabilization protein [Bacillus cereus]|uniref:plasmid stabilization protein n=1 Tax=Bacillus cereus TaxID=1396 RepID=UPI003012DD0C